MPSGGSRKGALDFQVAMRGRGLSAMSHNALTDMIDRYIDGEPPPEGITLQIHCWRAGREVDWQSVGNLRGILRRQLQAGHLEIRKDA